MREHAELRREARAKRGGKKAKDVIFEIWLKDPMLDAANVAASYPEVKETTVRAWFYSWLNGTSSPGLPASASGRDKEIVAARKKARAKGSIGIYQRHTSSESTPETPPPAPTASDVGLPPERVSTTVNRIIRDTELARRVKMLHRHKCQICGHTIKLPNGSYYAEAHHIQPLGQPHNGPDDIGNIVCVCPNHHAELDYGVSQLSRSRLADADGHVVMAKYIAYHNQTICSS